MLIIYTYYFLVIININLFIYNNLVNLIKELL